MTDHREPATIPSGSPPETVGNAGHPAQPACRKSESDHGGKTCRSLNEETHSTSRTSHFAARADAVQWLDGIRAIQAVCRIFQMPLLHFRQAQGRFEIGKLFPFGGSHRRKLFVVALIPEEVELACREPSLRVNLTGRSHFLPQDHFPFRLTRSTILTFRFDIPRDTDFLRKYAELRGHAP